MNADLDDVASEELIELAAKRSGVGSDAGQARCSRRHQDEHAEQRARQERKRRAAERSDPRPLINSPGRRMRRGCRRCEVLNDVTRRSRRDRATRDADGDIDARPQAGHSEYAQPFTNEGGRPMTKLPPPEQWVLSR